MNNTEVKKLYKALLSKGYSTDDLGDETTFNTKMSDPNNRKELYDWVSSNGNFRIGDYDSYERRLSSGSMQPDKTISFEQNNSVAPTPSEKPGEEKVQLSFTAPKRPELKSLQVEQNEYPTIAETTQKMMADNISQRHQLSDMTSRVQSALDRRGGELDEAQKANKQSYIPQGTAGSIPAFDAGRMYDSEYRNYAAAKESLQKAQDIIDAVGKESEDKEKGHTGFGGFLKGSARGAEDAFYDWNTWSMGLKDTSEGLALLKALDAAEGGTLTESQQALLDAKALEIATEQAYSSSLGRGYKAGKMTVESLPFMIEFAFNPIAGAGNTAANRLARYAINRFGKETVKKNAGKYIAGKAISQVATDALKAGAITATSGAGRTAADALQRMQGDIYYQPNEEGKVEFWKREGGEDATTAFAKAYAGTTIENFSEMLGNYFAPIGKVAGIGVSKGLGKVGLRSVNQMLQDVKANDLAQLVADFEKRAQWNGTIGEFGEEIAGGILNSIIVGDQTLDTDENTGLFNKDNLIDTYLGVALLGGGLSAAKTVDYPIYKYESRKNINNARLDFEDAFGKDDETAKISEALTSDDPRIAGETLRNIIGNEDYTPEQQMTAAIYAKTVQAYKGAKLFDEKMHNDPEMPIEKVEVADSYDTGRSLETPQEKNEAYNMYEYQAQNMRRIFGLDEDADVDAFIGDDPLGFAMQRSNENPDDGQAVLDYLNAKATRDGMLDAVNDKIDETIAQSNATIDRRKSQTDGLIHPAILKGVNAEKDRRVYIISGQVSTLEGSREIDTEKSDKTIIVEDAETGKKEFTEPSALLSIDEALDPEQEKVAAAEVISNTISEQAEREIEGILPFNVGESYTILDTEGAQHTVTILADTQDGNVQVSLDNAQEVVVMPKEQIQQMSEAYNIGRTASVVEAKKAMEQSVAPAEQVAEQTAPTPRIPLNELGEPMYEQAPVYDTWVELVELNEGNEDEAIDTANIMRDNAQAELDKAMKSPKVKGKTVSEIQAAKAEQKALIKQAQDKLNYWTDVANYRDAQIELMKRAGQRANIAKAQQASQGKGRYSEENAALGAPIDFRDYVMRAIATGGIRFIWKDSATGTRGLGSHTGLKSNEERNARIWLLNNENGLYPEEAAEQLLTSYAEELGYTPNIDTMDALSEILDVVGSYATPSSMFEAAQLRHADLEAETAAQDEADAQARVLTPIAESLGLTLDEYLAWEEMMYAETLPAFEADYEQITAIFVEAAQQEEILNQNNDERSTENADVQSSVHSEGGLSDGSQAGVGVLQGTQVDNGIADSRGAEAGQGDDAQAIDAGTNDISTTEVSERADLADFPRADKATQERFREERAKVFTFDSEYAQVLKGASTVEGALVEFWRRAERAKQRDDKNGVERYESFASVLAKRVKYTEAEDNTLGDRGSIGTGQGSNESNVGEGVADVPSADVFRAEEVDATTPQLSAKEEMRRKPLRARAKMWEAKVGVPVHLIETFEEVPTEDARNAILDGKTVTAWVTDGEVYLYMPYLRNRTEVDKTYIHEVVAHLGMKRLLGKEGYRQFCMRVYNEVMTEADRELYDAYPNVKNHAQAADEYIAHLSEDTDMESSIWQKVVRIFRDALRVLGIETALTNKDIQDMLRDSYRNLVEENVTISESEGTQLRSVYHGSGLDFNKFDHSFMGTGEGSQSFGWGTYVTEDENSARAYAQIHPLFYNKRLELSKLRREQSKISENIPFLKGKALKKATGELEKIKKALTSLSNEANRYLYSVEIPDDNGKNYIHWDKNVPSRIFEKLTNILPIKDVSYWLPDHIKDSSLASKITYWMQEGYPKDWKSWGAFYKALSNVLGSDKAASEFLNENGYVGISYPAGGGNAGNARNYVIFNESDLEIKDSTRFRVKEKAPETASVQKEHQPTVVSSADGTKVLKKIDSAIEEYENKSNYPRTLLGDIAKVLNARKQGSNSQYATFEAKNGKVFTIRLADHNAKVSTFDIHNEKDGISIIITAKGNEGIQNDGDAHIVEYFYDSIKLRKADGKPLVEILKSIKQTLYSGEYKDTTGLAEREEVNIRDGVRFRVVEPAPTFYSNAERAVENVRQEKATPEQWLKMIEKNGGLKAGEDKWLGLSDWLKASDKKTLTKQEVLDFIKENQIQIEEVVYGQVEWVGENEIYESEEFTDLLNSLTEYEEDNGKEYPYINKSKFQELRNSDEDFVDGFDIDYWGESIVIKDPRAAARYLGLTNGGVKNINGTRIQYTTDGLDNKREIALIVPTIESWNESDEIHFGDAGNGRAIAWVRFGETTDENGNRILVIDEVQSKRHQEGRERGYAKTEANDAFEAYRDQMMDKYGIEDIGSIYGVLNTEDKIEFDKLRTAAYVEFRNSSDIPSAPFEKNWAELAMKRMLRYAAENGFDKIAWTTGDQQAERYDISKSVDNIKSEDNNVEETADGTLIVKNITIYAGGSVHNLFVDANGIVRGREYDGKKLSDIVGKPLAEKLMEQGDFELEGDGLRIGGEGMKAFYDQMIPSFMNKYGKKWGVKVGEVTMPSLEENNTMHSIDVTDAMRESVMQGQPMFRITGYDNQFAELQSEYDALDKNDAKALNEWREKKVDVVESYLYGVADNFGMRPEIIVFNGADEEQMREAYDLFAETFRRNGVTPPTYEAFIKKALDEEVFATYYRGGDVIINNIALKDSQNKKMQYAANLFHEDAHHHAYILYNAKELKEIWDDVKGSNLPLVEKLNTARLYKDKSDASKGNEFIAHSIGALVREHKPLFQQFLRGENGVTADDVVKKLKYKKVKANFAVAEILNRIKDEYQESRNGESISGGIGGGRPNRVPRRVLQGNVPRQNGGRGAREQRGRFVLEPLANDVAQRGLREMVGEDAYNAFLMRALRDTEEATRRSIIDTAIKNGLNFHEAIEDYLASLAELENADSAYMGRVKSLFVDMLEGAGVEVNGINDNEVRYLLWRNNLQDDGVFSLAEDVVMQRKLGVGRFSTQDADTSFRVTEREQIIADAKANGTYLKAPNGKDTNLTPDQWVTVRTDAFKKWFGDWEKAARIEKLRKSKDAKITGNEIEASDDLKQYKKNAQLYGRTLQGEYTNADTGAVISLQRGRHNGGINEVLQHNYKDVAHLQSVAAIPQIIENGIYIESQPNKDVDTNPNVAEYQMFVCGLNIGGEDYTVLAKVAVDNNGNRYYDHNLVSVEKGKLIDIANNEQSAISRGFGTTPDMKSTTNSQRKYKELISLLQTNSSKIVDANGEPKVVYHRTPNEFTTFDTEKIGSSTDWGAFGMGFYFSPNSEQYGLYGKNEMALFLNASNPLMLDDSNAYDVKEPFFKNGSWNKEASEDFTKWVKDNGYDAVVYKTDFSEEDVAFSPNQIKSADGNTTFDANNDDIRFRVAPSTPVSNEARGVRESFDQMVKSKAYQMKEAGYDRLQSIKEYLRLASKAHGVELEDNDVKNIASYENPYIAMINKSSINEKEVKAWERKFYIPILDATKKIYNASKDKIDSLKGVFGAESIDDIFNNYLQGKHGLERNRDMAVKASLDKMEKATLITKQEAEQMLEQVNEELKNDIITPTQADARRQQIGNMLSTKKHTKEQVKYQTEVWEQRKKAIKEDKTLDTWRKKQEALDKVATTEFGVDLAERDYSGLGEVFSDKKKKKKKNLKQSIEQAYDAVEAFENAFDTKELWDAINAATESTLEIAFQSSVISRDTFDKIRSMYDYYIPLRGFEADTTEDVYGYLNNETKAFSMPVKRANGRASKAEFAIPHILQMAHSAILQGNNNRAKLAFANFAQHYSTDLVKQSNMWIEYNEVDKQWKAAFPTDRIKKDATAEQVSEIVDEWNAEMEQLAKENPDKYRKVKGKMDVPYIVPKDKMDAHQIRYKRNGVDYILTVNGSPRLAYAMNGAIDQMSNKLAGDVGEAVEGFTRYLSGMYTQYNPDFMVSNFFRDASFVLSTVWVRENPKYAAKFYKNYAISNPVVMTRLFAKYENGTLDRNKPLEAAFEDFMKNGGETGYAILKDVEQTKKRVAKDINRNLWGKVMALIDRLGVVGRGVESSARFAAYLTSREAGRSISRSVYDAKEVSVNFNRKGAGAAFNDLADQTKIGKIVGSTAGIFKITHAFFNAGVQGLAGISKLVKYHPVKGSALLVAPMLLGWIIASLFDDDDDYYNLSETVRRQNIIIPMGNDYISIPLAIELRAMYGIGEMMVSLTRGKEDLTDKNVAYKIAEQILQAFPINVLEGNGGFDALLPTAVSIVTEVMLNEDWQGMPIYREDKYTGDEYIPEWEMVSGYTDNRLVAASKFLSEATGGDYGERGTIEINPAVVQHIMEGLFGGPMSFFNKVTATYDTVFGDKEFEWRNVPFLNRVVKDGGGKAQERTLNNEYRNNKEKYEALHKQELRYNEFIRDESHSEEERAEYKQKLDELRNSEEYKRMNAFNEDSKDIDKMYKQFNEEGTLDENMSLILEEKEKANAPLR